MSECDKTKFQNDDIPIMPSCIPLPLCDDILKEIVPKAKDFALLNGAGIRFKDHFNPEVLNFAPFLLLPSTFPKEDFKYVTELQPHINLLMHKIAHDYDFLYKCLKNTIKVDDFTANLWNIYETVYNEGITQRVSLAILRSDVMLSTCKEGGSSCISRAAISADWPILCERQVEVNTIASGFGHMGPVSARIHRYVLSSLGKSHLLDALPKNTALEDICSGMISAHDLYCVKDSAILFIVEETTYNICDQRFHEYEIISRRPSIRVLRKTLRQVGEQGILDAETKKLLIEDIEISVVYFRCGYAPSQYPDQSHWDTRLLIERSKAIKCPSIFYHLAGAKKVQQELAMPGVLERYLSAEVADQVKQLFTGLYSLDKGAVGDDVAQMALREPHRFVLKPQREGGGHNIYGDDIKEVLSSIMDSDEREGYILMDRIRPPLHRNYIVRPSFSSSAESSDSSWKVELEEVVSELGIFGVILGTESDVSVNEFSGHMLRTKLAGLDEGGVAAGHGALDSVFLVS